MPYEKFQHSIKNRLFLTEDRLGYYLIKLFPNHYFEHDKTVPYSGIKHRADYFNEELKLVVEFDGYGHFTQAKRVIADQVKDMVYEKLGYKVIRIPYFVQISPDIIRLLFADYLQYTNLDEFETNFKQIYPHGFIDDTLLTLPADYCELGIINFTNYVDGIFKSISSDIYASLLFKYQQILKKNVNMSMLSPETLKFLVVPGRYQSIFDEGPWYYDAGGRRLPSNKQLTEFLKYILGGLCDEHFSDYVSEFEGKIITAFDIQQENGELTVPTFTIKSGNVVILDPEIDYSLSNELICSCKFFKKEEESCHQHN